MVRLLDGRSLSTGSSAIPVGWLLYDTIARLFEEKLKDYFCVFRSN